MVMLLTNGIRARHESLRARQGREMAEEEREVEEMREMCKRRGRHFFEVCTSARQGRSTGATGLYVCDLARSCKLLVDLVIVAQRSRPLPERDR